MCYSSESSIITFTVGIITSILCIRLNTITDKIIGYFFLFVSQMQLIDYFIWNHQKCDSYNKFLSITGMIFNHLQPVMLGIIVLLLNKNIQHKQWIIMIILLYLSVIVPHSIKFLKSGDLECTLQNIETKNLLWNWNFITKHLNVYIYIVFTLSIAFISILGFPTLKQGVYFAILAIITFVSSRFLYPKKSIGALWCFYILYGLLSYYILRITGLVQITHSKS